VRRSVDRILTTHVGSLIRPPELLELGAQRREDTRGEGTPSREETRYLAALQHATVDVVSQPANAGLDIVNDGEFGKSSWANYALDRMSGFELRPESHFEAVWLGRDRVRFREFIKDRLPRAAGAPGHFCVGPIQYRGLESVRRNISDLKLAMQAACVEEGFLTAVAPGSTGYDASNEYYPSERDYVFAIADALHEEYHEIHNSGLILQVDDAVLANLYDELVQESPARYREWAELRVDALNHALRGIPEDRIRYHLCFGSWHAPHVSDAPLEAIVDVILNVRAGAYSNRPTCGTNTSGECGAR
jgi:5-methyltetrahydropteroyltriglutamate--homocysteine methyltransferase